MSGAEMRMRIRKTLPEDLPEVMGIYAYARKFMAEQGNPLQWGPTGWPREEVIVRDIGAGDSYVCVEDADASTGTGGGPDSSAKERILAVFYFVHGEDVDPCYRQIEGAWRDPGPYGVVHRIASAEGTRGAGAFCIEWAFAQCGHLRMDTYQDNIPMRNLLAKLGFVYCGLIHVEEDDMPRMAFEKTE